MILWQRSMVYQQQILIITVKQRLDFGFLVFVYVVVVIDVILEIIVQVPVGSVPLDALEFVKFMIFAVCVISPPQQIAEELEVGEVVKPIRKLYNIKYLINVVAVENKIFKTKKIKLIHFTVKIKINLNYINIYLLSCSRRSL